MIDESVNAWEWLQIHQTHFMILHIISLLLEFFALPLGSRDTNERLLWV